LTRAACKLDAGREKVSIKILDRVIVIVRAFKAKVTFRELAGEHTIGFTHEAIIWFSGMLRCDLTCLLQRHHFQRESGGAAEGDSLAVIERISLPG